MNPYAPSWIPYSKHKPSSINNKLMVLISLPLPSLPTSFQSSVGHCLHRMFTHPLMRYLKSLCNVYPMIGMGRERELMAGPDCVELWWQLHPLPTRCCDRWRGGVGGAAPQCAIPSVCIVCVSQVMKHQLQVEQRHQY